jgi:hypothetical protein
MRRGFTVMELAVAMFVILVGFIAVARIVPNSYRGATVDKNRLIALRVARNVADKVASMPFPSSVLWSYLPDLQTLVNATVPVNSTVPVSYVGGESVEGLAVSTQFFVTGAVVDIPAPNPPTSLTPVGFGNLTVTVEWVDVAGNAIPSSDRKSLTLTAGLSREP